MTSEKHQDNPTPRRTVLPPLRTFSVRQKSPTMAQAVDHYTVSAHEIQFSPTGALCFIEYRMLDGEPMMCIPRVFNKWLDYEEVLVVASKLIH